MKVHEFVVGWHRQVNAWSCEMTVTIETASQFASEWHEVAADSRWWLLAVAKAWLAARRLNQKLAAKPGERSAKGWA